MAEPLRVYLAIMHIIQKCRDGRIAAFFTFQTLRGFLEANDIAVFKLRIMQGKNKIIMSSVNLQIFHATESTDLFHLKILKSA